MWPHYLIEQGGSSRLPMAAMQTGDLFAATGFAAHQDSNGTGGSRLAHEHADS